METVLAGGMNFATTLRYHSWEKKTRHLPGEQPLAHDSVEEADCFTRIASRKPRDMLLLELVVVRSAPTLRDQSLEQKTQPSDNYLENNRWAHDSGEVVDCFTRIPSRKPRDTLLLELLRNTCLPTNGWHATWWAWPVSRGRVGVRWCPCARAKSTPLLTIVPSQTALVSSFGEHRQEAKNVKTTPLQ